MCGCLSSCLPLLCATGFLFRECQRDLAANYPGFPFDRFPRREHVIALQIDRNRSFTENVEHGRSPNHQIVEG